MKSFFSHFRICDSSSLIFDQLAGNFARTVLLPRLAADREITLTGVATSTGSSGKHVASRFGFGFCTSDADELLEEATAKMIANDIGRLPVVDPENPSRLVGLLGRAGVMAAWLYSTREEQMRDSGWLSTRLKALRKS